MSQQRKAFIIYVLIIIVVKPTIVIIEIFRCYQVHMKPYSTYFSRG